MDESTTKWYFSVAVSMNLMVNFIFSLHAAAEMNKNQMLKCYHPGAYGSQHTEEWSCCKSSAKKQKGCQPVRLTFTDAFLSSTVQVKRHEQPTLNLDRNRFSSTSISSVISAETTGGDSLTSSSSSYSV